MAGVALYIITISFGWSFGRLHPSVPIRYIPLMHLTIIFVFVYRCVGNTGDIASRTTSIQVIDRRKGHTRVKVRWPCTAIHAVDRRMIVAIGSTFITVYALQEPDRSPQRRIRYLCPKLCCSLPSYMYSEAPSHSQAWSLRCDVYHPDTATVYRVLGRGHSKCSL
ncbi:hypothetical protein EV424DRAFT_1407994 [Suillus variegatus]|nr:hypothetical protein EV424DRAFT_1407994 [Suillus variegatus]